MSAPSTWKPRVQVTSRSRSRSWPVTCGTEVGGVQLGTEELRDGAVLVDELAVEGREPAGARVQADGRERRGAPALGAEDRGVEQPGRPGHGRTPARVLGVAGRPAGLHGDRVGDPGQVAGCDAEMHVPSLLVGEPREPRREVLTRRQPDQLVAQVAVGECVLRARGAGLVDRRRVGEQLAQGVVVVERDLRAPPPGRPAARPGGRARAGPWSPPSRERRTPATARPPAGPARARRRGRAVSTVRAANGLAHE